MDKAAVLAADRAAPARPTVTSGTSDRGSTRLWLAADVAVTTDAQQRVISWQDIVYGDNVSAEDAMQADESARPLLVSDASNGQPAIRFDGNSDYLLTTPLETTDDQTVLFVCQFSPKAFDKDRRWGGQIINYDGPARAAILSDTLEPGVLANWRAAAGERIQALAAHRPGICRLHRQRDGRGGPRRCQSGRAERAGDRCRTSTTTSTRTADRSGINGRSYGEARAFAPQGITSRKIIGRHAWMQLYFHGDLAELLIYNKALSPRNWPIRRPTWRTNTPSSLNRSTTLPPQARP